MAWEERWHPLRREWVVVSSHRDNRPWRGETLDDARAKLPEYDPTCYLCPDNLRVSGERNARYEGVFVFDNDHPCVGPKAPKELERPAGIYKTRPADGLSRVVCFTPRHDLTLAELPHDGFVELLRELQAQHRELACRPEVRHVLMFENKGTVVGVSNPHPHAQIYATNFVFRTIEIEAEASAEHLEEHGRPIFQDIIEAEEADGRRIVASNDGAIAFVPFFARYAYETYVAPRHTFSTIAHIPTAELDDFAGVLRETLIRLENLWRMPLPYVMVFHNAPAKDPAPGFHFHVQIHPPLRKPGLLKYLAGPEIGGGNFLNDTSPEAKAAELQAVSAVHYRIASQDA
ncbi:MAG TPA: galactose-1-phosphate uridylyltransferase [Gemmatimonadaceae bacterium]